MRRHPYPPCIEQGCENDRCCLERGYPLRCLWCFEHNGGEPALTATIEPAPPPILRHTGPHEDPDADAGLAVAHA